MAREVLTIKDKEFEFNRFTVELGNVFSSGARVDGVFQSKKDILSSKFFASLNQDEKKEITSRLD